METKLTQKSGEDILNEQEVAENSLTVAAFIRQSNVTTTSPPSSPNTTSSRASSSSSLSSSSNGQNSTINSDVLSSTKNVTSAASSKATVPKKTVPKFSKIEKYLNATKLNLYVVYKPDQYERRRIFREYTKLWLTINPPQMMPVSIEFQKTYFFL